MIFRRGKDSTGSRRDVEASVALAIQLLRADSGTGIPAQARAMTATGRIAHLRARLEPRFHLRRGAQRTRQHEVCPLALPLPSIFPSLSSGLRQFLAAELEGRGLKGDYVEVFRPASASIVTGEIQPGDYCCVAVVCDTVRLIDNISF